MYFARLITQLSLSNQILSCLNVRIMKYTANQDKILPGANVGGMLSAPEPGVTFGSLNWDAV